MPSNLVIHPTKPFKSSRLALPPSPFSPRFPLSSQAPRKPHHTDTTARRSPSPPHPVVLSPPPAEPLHWLWQCHLCNRVYRLGITRRCLEDGHFFCSGTTTVKRRKRGKNAGKKVVRHKACASEFDYAGWKAWGVWRREVRARILEVVESEEEEDVPAPLCAQGEIGDERWFAGLWTKRNGGEKVGKKPSRLEAKDWWGTCDYPSECRWGKQYGVATPTLPPPPPVPERDSSSERPKTTFEDILLTIPKSPSSASAGSASESDGDEAMQSPPLSPELPESPEEPTRKPSFDDLLESVKRRKRRSSGAVVDVPSPLSSHPPNPTTISMAQAMDLATSSSSEHIEDVAQTTVARNFGGGEPGSRALQRAFDDFDLDFRRSFERAGAALTGKLSAMRSTTALEEEKAESFVKGSRNERSRRENSREW